MPQPSKLAIAGILALAISAAPGALAQAKPSPPKSASAQNSTTLGAGPSTTNPTGGIIYGSDWIVLFNGIPSDWISDTGLAHRLGVQEIFHPANWNPRRISPCITFSLNRKQPGDATIAADMAIDESRARARYPHGKILPAPALAVASKRKAPVRIYEYPHGWDMVAYSEQGNLLFVTTLHCEKASQCASFKSSLAKFVASVDYEGNVTVIDKTKH
jgi:hypothetical protein